MISDTGASRRGSERGRITSTSTFRLWKTAGNPSAGSGTRTHKGVSPEVFEISQGFRVRLREAACGCRRECLGPAALALGCTRSHRFAPKCVQVVSSGVPTPLRCRELHVLEDVLEGAEGMAVGGHTGIASARMTRPPLRKMTRTGRPAPASSSWSPTPRDPGCYALHFPLLMPSNYRSCLPPIPDLEFVRSSQALAILPGRAAVRCGPPSLAPTSPA